MSESETHSKGQASNRDSIVELGRCQCLTLCGFESARADELLMDASSNDTQTIRRADCEQFSWMVRGLAGISPLRN